MKSVKFFSFLMSCGIFLANPSFAMDSGHKHSGGGHCKGCITHKETMFLKFSIYAKITESMKDYFSNNASKIELFKNDFNLIDLSKCKNGTSEKIYPLVFIDDSIMKPIIDEILEINKEKFSNKEKEYILEENKRLLNLKAFCSSETFIDRFWQNDVCFFIFASYELDGYYYNLCECSKLDKADYLKNYDDCKDENCKLASQFELNCILRAGSIFRFRKNF